MSEPTQTYVREDGQEGFIAETTTTAETSTAIVIETWPEIPAPHPARASRPTFTVAAMILGHITDRVRALLAMLILSIFVLAFLVQPFRIPSESMERTMLVGDFVLVNKIVFAPAGIWGWLVPYREPGRGDIVVFHFPLDPDEHVVKRVIGISGDRIHLKDGVVYRNQMPLTERYTWQPAATWARSLHSDIYRDNFPNARFTDPGVDAHWWAQLQRSHVAGDLFIPRSHFFVMGDDRNFSRDSRYWGFVPRANIVGSPLIIYFSVREPSRTDPAPNPASVQNDRLGNSITDRLMRFARWDRMLRIVE